jgi:hypothetical protein
MQGLGEGTAMEAPSSLLHPWADFAVIAGSSAAALTGLMFVVITLVSGVRARSTREGIAAFSTPTVVEFCLALLIAAAMTVPWPTVACLSAFLGAAALLAIAYSSWVVQRAQADSDYEPDLEDTLSYIVLPVVLYGVMLAGAIGLAFVPRVALFVLAGTALALIFLGIHNAWDVVTYVGLQRLAEGERVSAESTGTSRTPARSPADPPPR